MLCGPLLRLKGHDAGMSAKAIVIRGIPRAVRAIYVGLHAFGANCLILIDSHRRAMGREVPLTGRVYRRCRVAFAVISAS